MTPTNRSRPGLGQPVDVSQVVLNEAGTAHITQRIDDATVSSVSGDEIAIDLKRGDFVVVRQSTVLAGDSITHSARGPWAARRPGLGPGLSRSLAPFWPHP